MQRKSTAERLAAELSTLKFHSSVLECLESRFFECASQRELAEVLVSVVADRTGADKVALLLEEPQGGFRLVYASGLGQEERSPVGYDAAPGILWELVRRGEPFLVADFAGTPMFPRTFERMGLDQLGSRVWVPIRAKESALGVLTLDRDFTSEATRQFVCSLVARASRALERIRSRDTIERLRQELDQQERTGHLWEDWGRVLTMMEHRIAQLLALLKTATLSLEAERSSVMLLDEATGDLVVRAVHGPHGTLQPAGPCLRLKPGEGVAGAVFATGQARIVNRVAGSQDFVHPERSNVESILCAPLMIDGLLLGVMNFTNKKDGKQFDRRDQEQATDLAEQAARAIHNASLYELAVSDPLTGVYTRVHLHQMVLDEVRRATRYQRPLSLVAVALRDYRGMLKRYGSTTCNQALVEVARILGQTVRATDAVARLGPDSFALLLPETGAEGALFLGERTLQAFEEVAVESAKLEVYVGACSFPDLARSAPELLAGAEAALKGRNPTKPLDLFREYAETLEEFRSA